MKHLAGILVTLLALAVSVAGPSDTQAQQGAPIEADAVVHAIDGDTVNLTHDPIPAIGWPRMTMDLSLLDGADASGVQPGDAVTIELQRAPSGLFGVAKITPKAE